MNNLHNHEALSPPIHFTILSAFTTTKHAALQRCYAIGQLTDCMKKRKLHFHHSERPSGMTMMHHSGCSTEYQFRFHWLDLGM